MTHQTARDYFLALNRASICARRSKQPLDFWDRQRRFNARQARRIRACLCNLAVDYHRNIAELYEESIMIKTELERLQ